MCVCITYIFIYIYIYTLKYKPSTEHTKTGKEKIKNKYGPFGSRKDKEIVLQKRLQKNNQ
jgi:hypothetical protein